MYLADKVLRIDYFGAPVRNSLQPLCLAVFMNILIFYVISTTHNEHDDVRHRLTGARSREAKDKLCEVMELVSAKCLVVTNKHGWIH